MGRDGCRFCLTHSDNFGDITYHSQVEERSLPKDLNAFKNFSDSNLGITFAAPDITHDLLEGVIPRVLEVYIYWRRDWRR